MFSKNDDGLFLNITMEPPDYMKARLTGEPIAQSGSPFAIITSLALEHHALQTAHINAYREVFVYVITFFHRHSEMSICTVDASYSKPLCTLFLSLSFHEISRECRSRAKITVGWHYIMKYSLIKGTAYR